MAADGHGHERVREHEAHAAGCVVLELPRDDAAREPLEGAVHVEGVGTGGAERVLRGARVQGARVQHLLLDCVDVVWLKENARARRGAGVAVVTEHDQAHLEGREHVDNVRAQLQHVLWALLIAPDALHLGAVRLADRGRHALDVHGRSGACPAHRAAHVADEEVEGECGGAEDVAAGQPRTVARAGACWPRAGQILDFDEARRLVHDAAHLQVVRGRVQLTQQLLARGGAPGLRARRRGRFRRDDCGEGSCGVGSFRLRGCHSAALAARARPSVFHAKSIL